MIHQRFLSYLLLSVVVALFLTACGGHSPLPTLYRLEANQVARDVQPGSAVALGIRQVSLPEVIRRPQLVMIDQEKVVPLEFHRWSEPLGSALQRVLAENLRLELNSPMIFGYPWPRAFKPQRTLSVSVTHFHGQPGGELVLRGVWLLQGNQSSESPLTERFQIAIPVNGESYSDLVRAHSRAVSLLAQQIASRITPN